MGERKGVNKYYPPDFDYKKHGSLDRYHNSHPLRERARKLKSEGILIIRFEMPYNIWCNGCNKHIGMGVRYNAEKKKVGNYYSTIIYKFRMKCHLCDQYFEIQTDPANCEYVILSGARRKEERWDAKSNEQIEMTDHQDKKKLMTNPMYKLEHAVKDKEKLQTVIPTLSEIQELQDDKKDDYLLNKALRRRFRDQKKKIEKAQDSDRKLLLKSSLDIPLLEENEEDKKLAKLIKYNIVNSCRTNQKEIRQKIINESIFSTSKDNLSKQSNLTPYLTNFSVSDSLKSSSKLLGVKVSKRKQTLSNSKDVVEKSFKFAEDREKLDVDLTTTVSLQNCTSREKLTSTANRASSSIAHGNDLANINNALVANYSSDDQD